MHGCSVRTVVVLDRNYGRQREVVLIASECIFLEAVIDCLGLIDEVLLPGNEQKGLGWDEKAALELRGERDLRGWTKAGFGSQSNVV